MLEAVNFRPAIKSDIPQLIDLMNSQFSIKKDRLYFLWQYFISYYSTILMCAFIDSKLIGMFGLQKRNLENGAHVGQAIYLIVVPEWRKKGIFKLLGDKTIEYFKDLDLLCVFANLNGKNACEKAFGWKTLGKINLMCLHNDCLKNITKESLKREFSVERKQVFNKFTYNAETRFWRFDQHPQYKYIYVKLNTGEFAITKVFQDPVKGTRLGDIVDFECNLNNSRLLRDLFLKAVLNLKENNVERVTTWALPHIPLHNILISMGFVAKPEERYFCLKVLNKKYEHLYNIDRWHIVQSDAEIY